MSDQIGGLRIVDSEELRKRPHTPLQRYRLRAMSCIGKQAFTTPPHRLPSLAEAKLRYSRQVRESGGAIRSIECVCLLADDTLALVQIGARGGHKINWRFGKAA